MTKKTSSPPAVDYASLPPTVTSLVGCDVLHETPSTDTCESCQKPVRLFERGLVVRAITNDIVLIQWFEWGFGDPIYGSLVRITSMTDSPGWRLFADPYAFKLACRRVITAHDHKNIYPDIHDDKGWGG